MKLSSADPRRLRFVVIAAVVCLVTQSCRTPLSNVKPVPVQEIDAHGISLTRVQKLRRGDRAESVAAVLGDPADRRPSCVPGEVVWRYPIRAWNDTANSREIVPAVLLRVSFDTSGTLTDWEFVDSSTGRPLVVRETPEDALRWFQTLSDAPLPVPQRVELDGTLIRGRTTETDVERMLGQWKPDLHCGSGGPVPVVKKTKDDSGSVWDWYVDRPSPLFIPPRYLVASFDDAGALIVWHLEQTYPGGRK
jgi:hypothetical protein